MATVKVTFNLKTKLIEELAAPQVQALVGSEVVKLMKQFIAAGKSPVLGFDRFVGYKAVEGIKQLKIRKSINRQAAKATPAIKASARSRNRVLSSNIADLKSKGYPYSVLDKFPDKKTRPINLKLTGDMLRALIFKIGAKGPKVGIFEESEALKADTHNNGTQVPRVPRRKFIPNIKGDLLAVSIMRAIKAIYSKELNAIIKRSNAK